MKCVINYIERWFQTGFRYLLGHIVFHSVICSVTAFVCRSGVFEDFGSTKAFMFALLMCNVWSGIFNSITILFDEANHIMDELRKFLNVRVYIFANLVIQAVVCVTEAIVCTTVLKVGFNYSSEGLTANRSFEYLLTFFLILISSDMLGFAVGCAIKRVNMIMTAVPLLLIVQFLLSGCLYEINGSIMNTISKLTTAKWGFNGLGTVSNLNSLLPPSMEQKAFEYSSHNLKLCWLFLSTLTIVCVFAAGGLLYLRVNSEEKH